MGPGNFYLPAQKSSVTPVRSLGKPGGRRPEVKLAAWALMLAGGLLLLSATIGAAKDKRPTTRIVSGTVYDDTENIIFGATVELKDTQTGKTLGIYSQEAGEYQYTGLRFDHDYTITARYKGVSSEVRKISMFDTRWHLVMNLTVPKPAK